MIITQPFNDMFKWMSSRLQLDWSSDLRLICQVSRDRLVGVVAFNNFIGNTCMIQAAGDGKRWINKELLWAAADFPFNQCDKEVVLALVRKSHVKSIKLLRGLGFEESYTIKDGYMEGDDLMLLEIRRQRAEKWLALGEDNG